MNKQHIVSLLLLLAALLPQAADAQSKYGYISRKTLLNELPEMKAAQQQIDSLRRQYEAEVHHNETEFRRQFSEFLQVQKNLSEPILRKRQGDLQVAMERSLAFRKQAETVLKEAEAKLLMLVQERVDAAIRVVAGERGYELVVDTDQQAFPYLAPALSEDATAFVREKLQNARR